MVLKNQFEILTDGEFEVLTAIALKKRAISRRTVHKYQYIMFKIDSLIQRGYIYHHQSGEYELTLKGIREFIEFCPTHEPLYRRACNILVDKQAIITRDAIKLMEEIEAVINDKKDGS